MTIKYVKMTAQEFLSALFEVQIVAHIKHLQTASYAEHMALNGLYDGIPGLLDGFAESYQGKYGIITDYKQIKVSEPDDIIPYLSAKALLFNKYRGELTDGYLQNQVDTIVELFYSTIYKLKNLS